MFAELLVEAASIYKSINKRPRKIRSSRVDSCWPTNNMGEHRNGMRTADLIKLRTTMLEMALVDVFKALKGSFPNAWKYWARFTLLRHIQGIRTEEPDTDARGLSNSAGTRACARMNAS